MNEDKTADAKVRRPSHIEDDHNNRSSNSPAHWQGEPLPDADNTKTQDVGFDRRGSGRSRQYGRAGDYGEVHDEREERPQRGGREPDDFLIEHVRDVFRQSGLNVADVVVRVHQGVVSLDGYIDEADDRYVLERLAGNCRGTVAVENHLEIRSGGQ